MSTKTLPSNVYLCLCFEILCNCRLNQIATSLTDSEYKKAVDDLKNSHQWRENQLFQNWISKQWLPHAKVVPISATPIPFFNYALSLSYVRQIFPLLIVHYK